MAAYEGVGTFPTVANDVYKAVEVLAVQNIEAVKSTNNLEDAAFKYEIEDGMVIEEAVIEMAKAQAFDKDAFDKAPIDPKLHVKYFNQYEEQQFGVTVRRNDIKKIIANKGTGTEELAEKIISTLTSGESAWDFGLTRDCILTAAFKDYSTIMGGKPTNIDGIIFAARDMYNHLRTNNDDLTGEKFVSATPAEDIKLVIPVSLLNLIDVVRLANVFNLSKVEMMGKIIPMEDSDLTSPAQKYTIYVYDKKAIGRATRLYEYSQDVSGKGLYTNHYLTVGRQYLHNDLFKGAKLDCSAAATAEYAKLITPGK